jgi:hypothetical protein
LGKKDFGQHDLQVSGKRGEAVRLRITLMAKSGLSCLKNRFPLIDLFFTKGEDGYYKHLFITGLLNRVPQVRLIPVPPQSSISPQGHRGNQPAKCTKPGTGLKFQGMVRQEVVYEDFKITMRSGVGVGHLPAGVGRGNDY